LAGIHQIDLPLIRAGDMESKGIAVDPAQLRVLSGRMEGDGADRRRSLRPSRKVFNINLRNN
jgi:hypothetical protein